MYFFSFLKSLLRPSNFFATIYFLLNLVLVFFMFAFFNIVDLSIQLGDTWNYVINGSIGVALNILFDIIALSPIGEALFRFQQNAKIVLDIPQNQRILNIFNETYAKAKKFSPKLTNKIKLYYIESDEINAYAVGRRSLIINSALLNMNDEQIAGIMAHEFGHLAHHDCDIDLGIYVGNMILWVFAIMVRVLAFILTFILAVLTKKGVGVVFINFLFNAVILLAYRLWISFGMLMANVSKRKKEYLADGYAVDIGLGNELYNVLDNLEPIKGRSSMVALIKSSHPDNIDRLAYIDKKLRENQTAYNA